LGESFKVWNPFLFATKAQMCKKLSDDERIDLLPITKSCDSPHRNKIDQCGYCSSCLLRRQAIAAAKLDDRTKYLILHTNTRPAGDPSLSLRHMLFQVETLRSLIYTSELPETQWELITREFPILDDIVDNCSKSEELSISDMRKRLILLYQSYVTEWDIVKSQLSVGLTPFPV